MRHVATFKFPACVFLLWRHLTDSTYFLPTFSSVFLPKSILVTQAKAASLTNKATHIQKDYPHQGHFSKIQRISVHTGVD